MHQLQTTLENVVGKGEIARNKQFLLFTQCFLLIQIIVSPLIHILYLYLLLNWKSLKLAYQLKGQSFKCCLVSMFSLMFTAGHKQNHISKKSQNVNFDPDLQQNKSLLGHHFTSECYMQAKLMVIKIKKKSILYFQFEFLYKLTLQGLTYISEVVFKLLLLKSK